MRSGCQNRPPAAAALDALTPPPSRVIVQHATLASAISLLSTSQEACPARPESETRGLNVESSDSSDSSDEDVPSPKKTLPDFNVRKSGDDSLASGDDSITWEKEEDRVMHLLANQLEAENRLEEAFEDAPVRELEEWELITGEEEEGTADEVTAPTQEFETRTIQLKKTNVKSLKAIALMLNLAVHGKKEVLFNRIRDSPHAIRVINDQEFEYHHPKSAGEKIPTWILLTHEDVPTVEDIDMQTGAKKGVYGPTYKENATGANRTNVLTAEKIERPKFEPKKWQKKWKRGEADTPLPTAVREDGHPSNVFRKQLPPLLRARPAKDYFDTHISPSFIDWAVTGTNL
jgi:hypothetical protein